MNCDRDRDRAKGHGHGHVLLKAPFAFALLIALLIVSEATRSIATREFAQGTSVAFALHA